MSATGLAWRTFIHRLERVSFGLNRWLGIAQYKDPRPFLNEPREALFEACDRIGRDLPAYFRPPALADRVTSGHSAGPHADAWVSSPRGAEREEQEGRAGARGDSPRVRADFAALRFPSPIPSGIAANDTVEAYRFAAFGPSEGTLVFHHPAFRRSVGWIEWFTRPLRARFDVVAMTIPYHLARTPEGVPSGERLVNPNPLYLYQGLRQWMADHHALIALLEREAAEGRGSSAPVATIGYSLGAYLSLFYSQYDPARPVVAICPTNDYGHVVFDGIMLPSLRSAIEAAGFSRADWARMTDALRLDRYAPLLAADRILLICAEYDAVESPASVARLRDALRPRRTVMLASGHSTTAVLYRGRIMREALAFLDEVGLGDRPRF